MAGESLLSALVPNMHPAAGCNPCLRQWCEASAESCQMRSLSCRIANNMCPGSTWRLALAPPSRSLDQLQLQGCNAILTEAWAMQQQS